MGLTITCCLALLADGCLPAEATTDSAFEQPGSEVHHAVSACEIEVCLVLACSDPEPDVDSEDEGFQKLRPGIKTAMRSFFAQKDHMQLFNFILDCLDVLKI